MKITRLVLAGLLLTPSLPLRAQEEKAAPKPSCVCDDYNFKPLNDKAVAVAEYWAARRKHKITSGMAGAVALFAIVTRDLRTINTVNEAQNSMTDAQAALFAARAKAVGLGGISVTGDDDDTVEILLTEGVDYTLSP